MERRATFERLYEANYELILAYALRRATTPEDAADVVAETFLVAWRRLDQVPSGDGSRLWLFGVARMVLANQHRGQRRRERLGARLLAHAAPEAYSPRAPGTDGVAAVFGGLSEEDKEVLTLVAVEGLTPREVAVVLGVTAVTARVRLHRARSRFAARLRAEGIDP
ncbi:MAG: RNA polymerase sigma factor [Hamadaea sp.]|nr:RNA polymerase sigma factor [Hamadaea sp.]